MGFGKACLSALIVSVVVAWTTNATAEVRRGVILRVTAFQTLDGADLDQSRETVLSLLASAAIRGEWRDCGRLSECHVESPESIPINVLLLPLIKSTDGDVCGEFSRDALTNVPTVLIYVPTIAERVHEIRLSADGRSSPAIATMRTGHLIGAAMAHEVGHALGLRHGATGVMKARLDLDDVLALRRSRLAFTPSESASMLAPVPAATDPDLVALQVRAYATEGVDKETLRPALDVARRLFSSAGLVVDWRVCDTPESCPVEDSHLPEIVVILSSRQRQNGRENCGMAAHGDRDSAGTVIVSVPCVAGFAFRLTRQLETHTNPFLAMPRHDDLVGAIVAHEIGHLLGIRHSRTGLMRATLEAGDVIALRSETLRFSPAEAGRMRRAALSAGADPRSTNARRVLGPSHR